jgi:cis-3-alkyl-4-acyloxetan-2-one decarboxylase
MVMIKKFVHKTLRVPYKLAVTQDIGKGPTTVVFLHGIASSSITWRHVIPLLSPDKFRLITLDLLGFGESPKPDWSSYDLDAHANAVKVTLRRMGVKKYILVGHSMGSLVATRLAMSNPKKVTNLVLCSAPLYQNEDMVDALGMFRSTGQRLSNMYFSLYQAIIARPSLSLKAAQKFIHLAERDTSFRLDENTWLPFKKSLTNSIENQYTLVELQHLQLPIVIIYGQHDILILSKYYTALAKQNPNIQVIKVAAMHEITPKFAIKVAQHIVSLCND